MPAILTYQVFVALGVSCIIVDLNATLYQTDVEEGVGRRVRADGLSSAWSSRVLSTMGGVVMLVSIS